MLLAPICQRDERSVMLKTAMMLRITYATNVGDDMTTERLNDSGMGTRRELFVPAYHVQCSALSIVQEIDSI